MEEFYKERIKKLTEPQNVRPGTLVRNWDNSKRQAIVIGHSPSTADDDHDDQSTNKICKILSLFN
jgi:hypothetical protein